MTKVLTFKVEVKELESKIWRVIEITDSKTIAELAYTLLTIFHVFPYCLYNIKHNGDRYDCMIDTDDYSKKEDLIDANITRLSKIDFSKDNKMIMKYKYDSNKPFIITYMFSRDLEKGNGRHYPYIIDGKGRVHDTLFEHELFDKIKSIDSKDKSIHDLSDGYEESEDFDLKECNILLKRSIKEIKTCYKECKGEELI